MISKIELGDLALFKIPEFKAQALVIEVKDNDEKLKKINQEFKEFKNDDFENNNSFKPHITIAYLKNDFQIKDKKIFSGQKLKIKDFLLKKYIFEQE